MVTMTSNSVGLSVQTPSCAPSYKCEAMVPTQQQFPLVSINGDDATNHAKTCCTSGQGIHRTIPLTNNLEHDSLVTTRTGTCANVRTAKSANTMYVALRAYARMVMRTHHTTSSQPSYITTIN